jgi:hypothetical protein
MKSDLKKYIKSLATKEAKDEFATRCNTTFKHLLNVAYGYKPAGESLCINVERETNGVVRCESLRSDVDWSVLRNS